MDIEKHIVVKEIGTLTYPDVTPVYKHRGYLCLDVHGHSGYDIVFNPPVEVQWKYSEISIMAEAATVKKIEFEYDFGMKWEFFILVGAENPRFSNLGMNATPSTLTLNVFQNRSS
jgi:hypothetical protein